jgi:uncharacterized membrane protein
MIDGWLMVLTIVTAVASGLVAGFFFAFSTTVMGALARRPAAEGIAAMQAINVVVMNPFVMVALFGTALASVVLMVGAVVDWGPYSVSVLVAGAVYLVGMVGVTGAYNIPRNDAMAELDPSAPSSVAPWERYVKEWTRANHVRTIAPLATAALLTIALRIS